MGDKYLFPNFYTLLVADSAVQRKGSPVDFCTTLLTKSKVTKVISGRASIQGILDELGRGETDKQTGAILGGGSALFSAPELSAGIVNDPEAVKILTDIYEFKEEYTSRLRGSGIFRIKNICLNMLGASNESLLIDVYDDKAKHGGLLGRTFLVKPDEFRPGNSLFNVRDTESSFTELVNKLGVIGKIKGEFLFGPAAQLAYDNWYLPFRKAYEHKVDKSGISGRIHTSVLKLAMILCIDKTGGLTIEESHIKEAITECVALLPNYQSLIMSTGKSTVADVATHLIEDIWRSPSGVMTKREFLAKHFYEFDLEIVDKCIATLDAAGLVTHMIAGNESVLGITKKCIESFGLKEEDKGK